jgi:hypothetical protein
MLKHKKPMKFKKNLIIFGTGNRNGKTHSCFIVYNSV